MSKGIELGIELTSFKFYIMFISKIICVLAICLAKNRFIPKIAPY